MRVRILLTFSKLHPLQIDQTFRIILIFHPSLHLLSQNDRNSENIELLSACVKSLTNVALLEQSLKKASLIINSINRTIVWGATSDVWDEKLACRIFSSVPSWCLQLKDIACMAFLCKTIAQYSTLLLFTAADDPVDHVGALCLGPVQQRHCCDLLVRNTI